MPASDTWFKPGQSGNPSGRPKSRPYKDALNRALGEGGLDEVAFALVLKAKDGDVAAIKEIAERLDGKVPQPIAGSDEDAPIKIVTELSWQQPQPPPSNDEGSK